MNSAGRDACGHIIDFSTVSARATSLLLREMEKHAASSAGEVCGLVYRDRYIPVGNRSVTSDRFDAEPADLARALAEYGEPVAIFHSHPGGNLSLSKTDQQMWYYINSTMIIGGFAGGRFHWKTYGYRQD